MARNFTVLQLKLKAFIYFCKLNKTSTKHLKFTKKKEKKKVMACWSAENATKAYLQTIKLVSLSANIVHLFIYFISSVRFIYSTSVCH